MVPVPNAPRDFTKAHYLWFICSSAWGNAHTPSPLKISGFFMSLNRKKVKSAGSVLLETVSWSQEKRFSFQLARPSGRRALRAEWKELHLEEVTLLL